MRGLSVWNPWNVVPRWVDWDEEDMLSVSDMSMDVFEEGDKVVIRLVAPGFTKEDIDVTMEAGKITIIGKLQGVVEEGEKGRKYYRKEITQRSFTRSCALPVDVVPERAQATFKDGILTVTLPKSEQAKPKKISVNVG
jgi:HSP20 family protein